MFFLGGDYVDIIYLWDNCFDLSGFKLIYI